ncbi:hypothetical protein SAMN05421751_11279 [Jhaorihella thermophila]|uniref:Uncharacterized protein n=1 Tax=Jhaorihella thermophila TaxID=488547 RepID=A0A1H5XSS3_9RHOB|nr:hypothetical protein SAMN05421751_11279 [Jhaorihella thermophila]
MAVSNGRTVSGPWVKKIWMTLLQSPIEARNYPLVAGV